MVMNGCFAIIPSLLRPAWILLNARINVFVKHSYLCIRYLIGKDNIAELLEGAT